MSYNNASNLYVIVSSAVYPLDKSIRSSRFVFSCFIQDDPYRFIHPLDQSEISNSIVTQTNLLLQTC